MNPLRLVTAAAVLLMVAGCGDSAQLDSAPAFTLPVTTSPATVAPSSSVATTMTSSTSPDTTGPMTTTSTTTPATTRPETTSPATTATTATTTSAPLQTGWTPSDFQPAAFPLGYSGNWDGPPSPPVPADPSQAPDDGYYVATLREPWAPGDRNLSVRVQRLEYCTVIPGGCEYYDEGTDETNIDPSWTLDLDVPLDPATSVVVTGFSCFGAAEAETKRGTGADLVDLFTSFAADYDAAVRPLLSQGVADYEVAEAVAAAPTGGFVGEVAHCGEGDNGFAGQLRYVHADAPVLALQTVTAWDEDSDDPEPMMPTDLINLQGVEYRDGVPMFYFYAGLYS